MRALVADRSATTRRIVIRCLRVLGVQDVLEFADPREAAHALPAEPDLIVLEWSPADDAALDFVREARAREGLAPRIVVLSERDRRPDVERIVALDIQGYVIKPFDTQVLIEQLATVLQSGGESAQAAA